MRCALDKLDLRVCEAVVLVMLNLEWIIENDVFEIQGKFGVLIGIRECLPDYSQNNRNYQMYSICIYANSYHSPE